MVQERPGDVELGDHVVEDERLNAFWQDQSNDNEDTAVEGVLKL